MVNVNGSPMLFSTLESAGFTLQLSESRFLNLKFAQVIQIKIKKSKKVGRLSTKTIRGKNLSTKYKKSTLGELHSKQ